MKKILSPIQMTEIHKKVVKDLALQSQKEKTLIKMLEDVFTVHNQFLEAVSNLDNIINTKKMGPQGIQGTKGEKGDRGDQGEKGDKGQPGESITQDEIDYIIETLQSKIPSPIAGESGKDGKVTYDHILDITNMVTDYFKPLLKPQKSSKINPQDIIDLMLKQPKGKRLSVKHIDGLEQTLSALKHQTEHGYLHGGGVPSLAAGTGIKLVSTSDGGFIIVNTGTGGTSVYGEVVSFSGTSGTLAHTPTSGTLRLYRDGQRLQIGSDYTISGAVITLTFAAISANIFLADYSF